MSSAPHSDSYVVGTAHAGDDLADLCWVGSGGIVWDLVLDRTGWTGDHFNDTAAFIPESELVYTTQQTQCSALNPGNIPGLGDLPTANPVNGTGMTSAPYVNTYYVGTENYSSTPPFVIICAISSQGINWDMVLDYQGIGGNHYSYTTGFVGGGNIYHEDFAVANDC